MIATHSPSLVLAAVAALLLTSCHAGHNKAVPPANAGAEGAGASASGDCQGVPTVELASLFTSPEASTSARPEAGAVVAVEGMPLGGLACTLMGCDAKCCNNTCGSVEGCAYTLASEQGNLCLNHKDFACGGTDCSPWCRPFSLSAERRYRFVGTLSFPAGQEAPGATLHVQKFCPLN
ncbi:hypothetical protein POL68_17180 [Stigmatella sp. ncwal1]|uniref:Lipoprotein n=1 Tax=Stigmatella ashevillensis TaxID=2995309 RepID=A0ABT5D960_9BACT|nr:hypothetical protein [Stigmatella ashevillena]MDC0710213.1 hypothetical protein [Stigmatella ashevillena]